MNTPDMERHLLIQEVNGMLQHEWGAKRYFAQQNQKKIARELGVNRRAMNGLGRVRMEVDTEIYHYYGQRYGYKCWRDEDFLRWHEQHHPELKVQCGGTKEICVGWEAVEKKYSQNFGGHFGQRGLGSKAQSNPPEAGATQNVVERSIAA